MILHPFEPVYDSCSKILILGTIPSVASRKENFYYGHPRNRFWRVLAVLTQNPVPETIEEKKLLLHKEHIAVWDVLKSCDIEQSKDDSITNPVPNDFRELMEKTVLKAVFTNGGMAEALYKKLCYPETGFKSILLPSTSPANAGFSFEKLLEAWKQILDYL